MQQPATKMERGLCNGSRLPSCAVFAVAIMDEFRIHASKSEQRAYHVARGLGVRVDSCETRKTVDHSFRGVVLFVCVRERERKKGAYMRSSAVIKFVVVAR